MWGVVKKDFYDTFCIPKNLLSNILGYLAMIILAVLMGQNRYMMMLFVVVCIPMTTISVFQMALEQDEKVQFDEIMLTYPVTKKEIILARFIDNFIYMGINTVISVIMVLGYVYLGKTVDIRTGMFYVAAGIAVSLIATAVFSIGFYLLGNKKGTILYVGMVIIVALFYGLSSRGQWISRIFQTDPRILTGIALILGGLLMAGSYWVCLKIYTRQHS
ncbi:MAG: ABC-2 transporter permease [Blautia sp.]|uniref:ABC-2 transporter permease n=1 Tax=Blautia sp. TaxID=1955243 RepID=UPI002A750948|nr:ABC-2 transporter permease [Blautia sp.]MDY3016373.1 ABC-2 transporter permease [Blautia sp.]